MTISKTDELMMMGDDLINYEALSDQDLSDLVLADEDPFVATSALYELAGRKSILAGETALTIFSKDLGDQWLQASAFGVLYRFQRNEAIAILNKILEKATLTKPLLESIIECLDREEIGRYLADASLKALLYRIRQHIQDLGQSHLSDPDLATLLLDLTEQ